MSHASAPTLFDAAGGMPFFETLVGRFYESVAADPVLRRVYPEPDLSGAQHRLTLFLADRKSTRLNSSHIQKSRMPSSA